MFGEKKQENHLLNTLLNFVHYLYTVQCIEITQTLSLSLLFLYPNESCLFTLYPIKTGLEDTQLY